MFQTEDVLLTRAIDEEKKRKKINERIVMHNFTAVGFYLIYSFPFKKTLPKVILGEISSDWYRHQ